MSRDQSADPGSPPPTPPPVPANTHEGGSRQHHDIHRTGTPACQPMPLPAATGDAPGGPAVR
eukprot:1692801-Prymnesium_polylepis.1